MTALNIAAFQKPASTPAAPKADDKPDWSTVEAASLGDDLQQAYYAYRKAQDAATKFRLAFESAMGDKVELPAHLRLAFAYKFGKISVAIVKAERPRTGKSALSLADLIARANRAG